MLCCNVLMAFVCDVSFPAAGGKQPIKKKKKKAKSMQDENDLYVSKQSCCAFTKTHKRAQLTQRNRAIEYSVS